MALNWPVLQRSLLEQQQLTNINGAPFQVLQKQKERVGGSTESTCSRITAVREVLLLRQHLLEMPVVLRRHVSIVDDK